MLFLACLSLQMGPLSVSVSVSVFVCVFNEMSAVHSQKEKMDGKLK